MKFVVFGATGTVGSRVARELIDRGHRVRIPTRNPAKARHFGTHAEVVKADLLDPYSLTGLYDGMDGAFLVNALSQTEASEGITAVLAMRKSGLKRLVYLSVQHVDRAPILPHFGGKLGVEAAVQGAGIPWTILRPSNFFQNDEQFRDALLQHGVYPQPLGSVGVSRVDVRDIAEIAALALTQAGHERKIYDVVGPQALTGELMAEAWSRALGRKITYGGDDLEAWEKQTLHYMPGWFTYDFKNMYRHFQERGLRASEQDVVKMAAVLGHPPRAIDAYAAETAREWTREGAAART